MSYRVRFKYQENIPLKKIKPRIKSCLNIIGSQFENIYGLYRKQLPIATKTIKDVRILFLTAPSLSWNRIGRTKIGPKFFCTAELDKKELIWISTSKNRYVNRLCSCQDYLCLKLAPGGGGGTQKSFIRGGSAPRSNPLPFYIPYFHKRHPFHVPFI